MAMPGISKHVVEGADRLAEQFAGATPFPHVVIDDFFETGLCQRLIEAFPPFEGGCATNEHGSRGGKATYENVRSLGPAFQAVDDVVSSQAFLELMAKITGIPNLVYDPEYVGGGTHENLPGQDLDPHVDFNYHPSTGLHRRLNAIVYLNVTWNDSWGGAIELHKDPWHPEADETHRVLPLRNRCVLFETSERSWHGFQAITPPRDRPDLSRKSFAIYLYTKDRPAEQTAPRHATVYVERPLPDLHAGEAMGFERANTIRRLIHRRATHAKRLAAREEQQTQLLAQFVDALARRHTMPLSTSHLELLRKLVSLQDANLADLYAREKQLSELLSNADTLRNQLPPPSFPLEGSATLVGEPSGYWPTDQWAGEVLSMRLRLHHRIGRVEVRGFLPEHAPEQVHLRATVGASVAERHIQHGEFTWSIPAKAEANQDIELVIRSDPSWTPAALGVGTDKRRLSFVASAVIVE